jgi:hypothetical protein
VVGISLARNKQHTGHTALTGNNHVGSTASANSRRGVNLEFTDAGGRRGPFRTIRSRDGLHRSALHPDHDGSMISPVHIFFDFNLC